MRALVLLTMLPLPQWAAELSGTANFWKPFLDERGGFAAGAALRVPVAKRVAVRPEVLGGSIDTYRRAMMLGSVTVDVTRPEAATVGYVVGSAGLQHTRDRRISYSHNEAAFLAGGGLRYKLNDRWVMTVEARFGLDAFPLITAGFGYRFGGTK